MIVSTLDAESIREKAVAYVKQMLYITVRGNSRRTEQSATGMARTARTTLTLAPTTQMQAAVAAAEERISKINAATSSLIAASALEVSIELRKLVGQSFVVNGQTVYYEAATASDLRAKEAELARSHFEPLRDRMAMLRCLADTLEKRGARNIGELIAAGCEFAGRAERGSGVWKSPFGPSGCSPVNYDSPGASGERGNA